MSFHREAQKIETYLIDSKSAYGRSVFVQKHLDEGRQGYLICPLIEEDEIGLASVKEYAGLVKDCFPHASVGILHGKMKPAEKDGDEGVFRGSPAASGLHHSGGSGGVDVPNAVIMLIENAERYGLSQLHQLRGRIGRGSFQSTCILVTDIQNEDTLKRLKLFRDTSDGFQIADADLKLRVLETSLDSASTDCPSSP